MILWRYNEITGYWVYARSCEPETAQQWLAIWQKDEPNASFKLAKHRPTKAPK